MTPFLHHLAGVALGEPIASAARVSLPPRFAPSSDAASPRHEDAALDDQDPAARSHPAAPPLQEVSSKERDRTLVPIGGVAAPRPAGAEAPHRRPRESRVPSVAAPGTPTPRASGTEGHTRPERPPAGDRPGPRRGLAIPASVARLPQPSVGQADRPVVLPPTAAARDPRVAPRPLSDAAVASRVRASRDTGGGPVIHVTIDRIDVRAPAAATPPPARRRENAEPSVSLAEYLRGGEPAGRA